MNTTRVCVNGSSLDGRLAVRKRNGPNQRIGSLAEIALFVLPRLKLIDHNLQTIAKQYSKLSLD